MLDTCSQLSNSVHSYVFSKTENTFNNLTDTFLHFLESNLQDGLFHEYKKYGSIVSVKFYDEGVNRHAIVVFRKPEQAEKALIESKVTF